MQWELKISICWLEATFQKLISTMLQELVVMMILLLWRHDLDGQSMVRQRTTTIVTLVLSSVQRCWPTNTSTKQFHASGMKMKLHQLCSQTSSLSVQQMKVSKIKLRSFGSKSIAEYCLQKTLQCQLKIRKPWRSLKRKLGWSTIDTKFRCCGRSQTLICRRTSPWQPDVSFRSYVNWEPIQSSTKRAKLLSKVISKPSLHKLERWHLQKQTRFLQRHGCCQSTPLQIQTNLEKWGWLTMLQQNTVALVSTSLC